MAKRLNTKKLLPAYRFMMEMRPFAGWAGLRRRVYIHEVLKMSPQEYAELPYHRKPAPPRDWNLPPEYMVAYQRRAGRLTRAQAIEWVKKNYLPRL